MAVPLLLKQADPQRLPAVNVPAEPHVDWRAIEQWRLEESALPTDTRIHFRAPTFWETHWAIVLGAGAALLAQTAMIVALLIQRRRRKAAERQLEQANEHMEVAISSANLGLWSWIPVTDQVWTTPHCRQMTGLSDDSRIDLNQFLLKLVGRRSEGIRAEMLKALERNGVFQREFRLAGASGNKRWLSATGYSMRSGHNFYMTGTLVDVSERKLAQIDAEQQRQQVIHLTRVATLGELSGALAHELNQPLTAILTNAQTAQRLISKDVADLSELREILVDIVHDDHRAGAVLNKLRSLIRKEEVCFSKIDINQTVDEVLDLVHSDLVERRVNLVRTLPDGLPSGRGDPVQIQQVLINLIRNACDAMQAQPMDARQLVVETNRVGNDCLSVTVSDNGIGLAAGLHDHLFEPFVTTKTQGMGLGLAICRSILTAHGGKIWCNNNAGGGAVFGFSLPIFEIAKGELTDPPVVTQPHDLTRRRASGFQGR
jgi:C4-dicarboxylate-specific signal transduction histidine kinase